MPMLEAWWYLFTAQGWGNWEVDIVLTINGVYVCQYFDLQKRGLDVGKPSAIFMLVYLLVSLKDS